MNGNLTQTQFTGLNLLSTPYTKKSDESTFLYNMDVSPSGGLRARRGTRVVHKEVTGYRASLHELSLRTGHKFVVSKNGYDLRIFEYDYTQDKLLLHILFENVFTNTEDLTYSVNLPDLFARLLLLSESTTPIVLSALEYSTKITGSSFQFEDERWSVEYATALVYVNDLLATPVTITHALGITTVTLANPVIATKVDVVLITWQWWAEARLWYGENFFYGTSRYGASIVDQHVQVPPVILSDSEEDRVFSIMSVVYKSNAFNDLYTRNDAQQPIDVDEYSWSDGTNWTYDGSLKTITKSPQFITFGRESSDGRTIVTDDQVDYASSLFIVPFHPYYTYDTLSFNSESGTVFSGLTPGQEYYVKKIDDDSFELYTDKFLTTKVLLSARPSVSFTDVNVDYNSNLVNLPSHGLLDTDQIRLSSTRTNPSGLNSLTPYYVEVVDANNIRLYIDINKTQPVQLFPRSLRTVEAPDYDDAGDAINTVAHALYELTGVRFDPMYGTLPAGITAFTLYYAEPITDDVFALYADAARTVRVTNFAGAVGTTGWYVDGGVHTLTIFSGSVIGSRQVFRSVYFSRRRQVPFNNKSGVLPSNLDVYVNGDLVPRSTVLTAQPSLSYYTYNDALDAAPVLVNTPVNFVAFESSENVGLERADVVQLINKETRWVGSAGVSTANQNTGFTNGSYIPIYGLGDWANFKDGVFPTLGVVFQGRLILSGFNNKQLTLIWSAVSDSVLRGQFFNYFQITNDLQGLPSDPFDLIIGGDSADKVTALVVYQSSLFAFTPSSAWRSFSNSIEVTAANKAVGRVANQGALNPNCVVATQNSILYMSAAGVFDLSIAIAESNYLAAEMSARVRPLFNLTDPSLWSYPWIVYDADELKVYVALIDTQKEFNNSNNVLLVYDILASGWSQYVGPYIDFSTYNALFMYDTRPLVLFSAFAVCYNVIARFKYDRYLDFCETIDTSTLPVEGLPPVQEVFADVVADTEYTTRIWTTGFSNFEDLYITAGSSSDTLQPLIFNEDYEKTTDGKLVFFNDYAYVVIREAQL